MPIKSCMNLVKLMMAFQISSRVSWDKPNFSFRLPIDMQEALIPYLSKQLLMLFHLLHKHLLWIQAPYVTLNTSSSFLHCHLWPFHKLEYLSVFLDPASSYVIHLWPFPKPKYLPPFVFTDPKCPLFFCNPPPESKSHLQPLSPWVPSASQNNFLK